MKGYRAVIGLWLLLCFGVGSASASSWQDEPEARLLLHQQGLELALADVHPKLTLWWQQAVSARLSMIKCGPEKDLAGPIDPQIQ